MMLMLMRMRETKCEIHAYSISRVPRSVCQIACVSRVFSALGKMLLLLVGEESHAKHFRTSFPKRESASAGATEHIPYTGLYLTLIDYRPLRDIQPHNLHVTSSRVSSTSCAAQSYK